MKRAPFFIVFGTLWKMLTPKKRFIFGVLVLLLFLSGILEMTGMLFIFGFIQGLHVEPETGERGGRLIRALHAVGVDLQVSTQEYVLIAGGLLLVVLATKNLVGTLVQFALRRFLMKLNQKVSEGLLEGYLASPYEVYLREGTGGPATKIRHIFDVFSACFGSVSQVLADGALILVVSVLLCFVNPVLTLGAATTFALAGAVMYFIMQKTLIEMGRREQKAKSETSLYLADAIQGLVEIRLREATSFVRRGYSRALQKSALLQRRIQALHRLPRSSNEMLLASMLVGTVLYITSTGSSVEETLPTLVIFGYAGMRMTGAMTRINNTFQVLRRRAEEFEQYYHLALERTPETFGHPPRTDKTDYRGQEEQLPPGVDGRLHSEIRLKNVTYTYPGASRPALRKVNLRIHRGAFVSFCGPSGGGKSTLVMALMGLIRPNKGWVFCDKRNIQSQIVAWHQNIGYVGQKPYLSARTVRENIAFSVPEDEIDDQKVDQALKLACAEDFVQRLPKGTSSVLKEQGANLSGGERQRLIIARALYHDPEILVFDEATAALDNTTEREITAAIQRLSATKTVICVAHRLSTIRESDVIFVVEDGGIVGQGTYDELLESNPTFRALAATMEQDADKQTETSPQVKESPSVADRC